MIQSKSKINLIQKYQNSQDRLENEYINIKENNTEENEPEYDNGFTFNFRKESKAKELSEISYKDKYDQVYDNYINSLAYIPGYKNRSNAIKAALNFGQAQNSFSYPSKYDKIPPIPRNEEENTIVDRNKSKSVKMKKGTKFPKGLISLSKRNLGKHLTPQKESSKF